MICAVTRARMITGAAVGAGLLAVGLVDALGREGLAVAGWAPQPVPPQVVLAGALAAVLVLRERPLSDVRRALFALLLPLCLSGWIVVDVLGDRERLAASTLAATLTADNGSLRTFVVEPFRLRGPGRAREALGVDRGYRLDLDGV